MKNKAADANNKKCDNKSLTYTLKKKWGQGTLGLKFLFFFFIKINIL